VARDTHAALRLQFLGRRSSEQVALLQKTMTASRKHLRRTAERLRELSAVLTTLGGDSILAAAVITYTGMLPGAHKAALLARWKRILADEGVPCDEAFSLCAFMAASRRDAVLLPHSVIMDAALQERVYSLSLVRSKG